MGWGSGVWGLGFGVRVGGGLCTVTRTMIQTEAVPDSFARPKNVKTNVATLNTNKMHENVTRHKLSLTNTHGFEQNGFFSAFLIDFNAKYFTL